MSNLYILGDSFFEHPRYDPDDDHKKGENWIDMFRTSYPNYCYQNLAKAGTGSFFAMESFFTLLEKDVLKENDIVIIHLSAIRREMMLSKTICFEPATVNFDFKYCKQNNSFFISYLYLISQKLKFRLIIFSTDIIRKHGWKEVFIKRIKARIRKNNFARQSFFDHMIKSNNSYFHLSEYDLFDVEFEELILKDLKDQQRISLRRSDMQDTRLNHLSLENHYIMSDYISTVLENFDSTSGRKKLPVFKKNFKKFDEIHIPASAPVTEKEIRERKKYIYDVDDLFDKKRFLYE